MELWLVRHGESEAQIQGLLCGDLDIPLTDRGREQARELGQLLIERRIKFDQVLVSPLHRARETAMLAGLESDQVMAGLKELALGEQATMTYSQAGLENSMLIKMHLHPNFVPPRGESLNAFLDRASDVIDSLPAKGRIALVAHAGFFNALLMQLFEIRAKHFPFIDMQNCRPMVLTDSSVDGQRNWRIRGQFPEVGPFA